MPVAARLPVLVVLLLGLSGCLSLAGPEDRNGTIRDTAEQFMSWRATVDDNVAAEIAGRPPEKFSDKPWVVWWGERIAALRDVSADGVPAFENPEWYVAYVADARRRAGLAPLPAELEPRPCEPSRVGRCWQTTAFPKRAS